MTIVDAQVHIWEVDRPDRPWKPGERHRAHREIPLSADALLKEMDAAGVDRAVLVPPSWEGDRNDVVLAAAAAQPDRFAVMGRLPIIESEGRPVLEALRGQPGLLGLRFTFHKDQSDAWLHNGTADWLWPAAEAAGIALMIHVPRSIEVAATVARAHPGLRLIIDHLAMERPNTDEAAFANLPRLLILAELPNVAVKATALPSYSTEAYPFPRLRAPLQRIIEAFGAERVFWGSDMTRVDLPYRRIVTHFTEELPFLSDRETDLIMGRAICDWLGWSIEPAPAT